MAIITYTCDTCSRSVDIPQYKKGFEVFRNCVITMNCKGILSPTSTHTGYTRGTATPVVPDLVDWVQRSVLYTHTQQIAASVWKLKHNLNNKPDVDVFIYDGDNLIKITPSSIDFINSNELVIYLPLKYKGVVQCVAKYNNAVGNVTPAIPVLYTTASSHRSLTIAVTKQYTNPTITLGIHTAGVKPRVIEINVFLSANDSLMAWGDASVAHFNGKNYNVYTIDLSSIIPDNITSAYALTITEIEADNIPRSPIIQHKGLVWLLLSDGNAYSDKSLTAAVDVTKLTTDNNITSANNITSINNNIITDIYPIIKII